MGKSSVACLAAVIGGLSLACLKPTASSATPAAASAPVTSPEKGSADVAFTPTISISPRETSLRPGATCQFSADINYDPDGPHYIRQPVSFLLQEKNGGTLDETGGLYTAPKQPGTYHIIARREDFPKVEAKATVTVKAK